MTNMNPAVLIFTDVDGCLLNRNDYSYQDALPTLRRLRTIRIPVILSSSKTASELGALVSELELHAAPLICENGARIIWRGDMFGEDRSTVCGAHRANVLAVLGQLKPSFHFHSFNDLGLEGVMRATDLPRERAIDAMDREGTEPLLWDDEPERMDDFRNRLVAAGLTLTKGARFWHAAGKATKGEAMREVADCFRSFSNQLVTTIAVGDSPIDQSMLDQADWPVGIPGPDGSFDVIVDEPGIVATRPGAKGWGECVGQLLDRILSTV